MCKRCRCVTPASQLRWLGGCAVGAALCVSVSLVAASFGFSALSTYIDNQVAESFILKSSSAAQYPPFMDSDNPDAGAVYSSFYVYNVTNAEAVVTGASQPAVVEVGPLVYSYHNKKFNATWSPDGGLLSYMQYQYYLRDAGDFNVTVTTLNMPLLAALNIEAAGWLIMNDPKFKEWRKPSALFIQRTVEEVVFGWHDDPLLVLLSEALKDFGIDLPTTYSGVQVMSGPVTVLRRL
jgi:hypothetical protein